MGKRQTKPDKKRRKRGRKERKERRKNNTRGLESDSSESGGASPSECGIDFYRGEQGSRRIRQGSTRAFSQATLNRSCSSEKAVLSSAEGGKDRPGTKGGRHLLLQSPRMPACAATGLRDPVGEDLSTILRFEAGLCCQKATRKPFIRILTRRQGGEGEG